MNVPPVYKLDKKRGIMQITREWLEKHKACKEGINWVMERPIVDGITLVKNLYANNKLLWANWLLVRLMTKEQKVQYAIFAAEQVMKIYEEKYPDIDTPRKAIEATKEYLKQPSEEMAQAAYDAAACAATVVTTGVHIVADVAAYAAYVACVPDDDAATAAYRVVHTAARTADSKMLNIILEHGMRLLMKEESCE